ncbi:hypothetical protein [Acinetobacter baumannii]|uniref:hypothetical protein n=1 Tax=Acinetobacter baumannii TaxID=470 RepID=UPI003139E238
MANKSLNEKFKIIGFWTFGGIFWYLLISFFLLSDYPIQDYPFNHKKTYEVLKDALSLAAAFLAPVAAFVLFSNWREQHIEVEVEKGGIELDGCFKQKSRSTTSNNYQALKSHPHHSERKQKKTYYDSDCSCAVVDYCVGPRGGHYCITSGGNKRYKLI